MRTNLSALICLLTPFSEPRVPAAQDVECAGNAAALSKRNRLGHALAMAMVVGLGLLWRSSWLELAETPIKYGGDALWALLVFLGLGFLFPRWPTRIIALLAITFSALIEFSQLYHAPWIDSIRKTRFGAMVLGSVFNWPDFGAYAIGIALGVFCEWLFSKRPSSRSNAAK